jgi:hypothetical protein
VPKQQIMNQEGYWKVVYVANLLQFWAEGNDFTEWTET